MENDHWTLENIPGVQEMEEFDKVKLEDQKNDPKRKRIITKQINQALVLFKTSNGKLVKKEYLRVAIIRKFKKLVKKVLSGNYYKLKLYQGMRSSEVKTNKLLLELVEMIKSSLNVLECLTSPDNTPTQDFTILKKKTQNQFKTYNNKYLLTFFNHEETRKCFYYFVNYLFADLSVVNLSKALKIKCCDSTNHCEECFLNWKKLQQILLYDIFENIGLRPWRPTIVDDLKPSHSLIDDLFFEVGERELLNDDEITN
jgi:hypothetical protein